jgi:protein involved in polysaccharide export with SLBB domain
VGKLRPVRIFVIGNVRQPGVFTVPALSSAFRMLFYAGGVTEIASLRHVLIVREDKIFADLDFYEFLTSGRRFANIRLQNNDVVVVPAAEIRVSLDGAVNTPAVFEMKPGEGIKKLFGYAGGLQEDAYYETIEIERIVENKDRKIINIDYKQLLKQEPDVELQNGDRILVMEIERRVKNYITIEGPVFGPRQFEYFSGLTIKQLFSKVDSVGGDAYLQRVQITRTLPDLRYEIFSINLESILAGRQADFMLAPEDKISILSTTLLFPPDSVTIFGAVKKPGKYSYQKNMTLKDLIFIAGGYTNSALYTEAEVSRIFPRQKQKDALAEIYYVTIDSVYIKKDVNDDGDMFLLAPYDHVFVRNESDWEFQRNVMIEGEVDRPGPYTLKNKTTRITDLINRAGGLKPTAYLAGSRLYRSGPLSGQIGIDFEKIFEDPDDDENIFLQDGDRIVIPEKLATVQVFGGVNFPSNVLFEKGEGLDFYIEAAGGFSEMADRDNVTIRLANGRPVQRHRFLFWKYLSDDITAGSTIYIPTLKEKDETDWSGAIRDTAAILVSIATVFILYDSLNN